MTVSGRPTLVALVSFIFIAMIMLAGCGGSSAVPPPPPPPPFPNGAFSNASLNGPYAFSLSGTNTGGFFTMVGSLQADGNGTITGAVLDINSFSGVFTNQSASGTYTVQSNGQASASLTSTAGNFTLDFVVISPRHALVIRFNNNATASGSMDAQSAGDFAIASLTGPFVFNISGIDASSRALASAGSFTSNGTGTITSGVQDFNDNGTVNTNLALSGSFAMAGTNGRGVGSLTTSLGTLHFVFYIVAINHLKLMETDIVPVLAGDAFSQSGPFSNATFTGPAGLTVGGSSVNQPYAAGAIITSDGAGNITSGTLDVNNHGVINQNLAVTGTYSIAANGRGTMSLNTTLGTSNFVIYAFRDGLQLLETDSTGVTSGAAFGQLPGLSTNSIQGRFGWVLTGASPGGEIDSRAEFSADGTGHVNGTVDFNNVGSLSTGLSLSGTYSLSNGRGPLTLQSSFGTQNLIIYEVNGRTLFIEVDNNLVAVGEFEGQ